MANTRKKASVPPTRTTAKAMAQIWFSTAAASIQSFFISFFVSSSAVDGGSVASGDNGAKSFLQLLLPASTLGTFLYVTTRDSGDDDDGRVAHRHAASLSQNRFLVCYVEQHNITAISPQRQSVKRIL